MKIVHMNEYDAVGSLIRMFRERFRICEDPAVFPMEQAGGDRRYFRLSGAGKVCLGTYTPDPAEGRSFVELSKAFKDAGVPVPEVYAVSDDYQLYLQEDLGDISLFSILGGSEAAVLVRETLMRLMRMQKVSESAWKNCCLATPFCRRQVMWDLNYFKYEYLKPAGIVFDESLLEDDFERMAVDLCGIPDEFLGFMMRDCQSRNVMITRDGPEFIDFQGGRKGPVLYDAVSLLWQARAGFSNSFRLSMIDFYADAYCDGDKVLKEKMLAALPVMVLFRTLQVLGAYGFRGLVQHRAQFIVSIPGALANLRQLLQSGSLCRYPELCRLAWILADDIRFASRDNGVDSVLEVSIFSFSYKRGYPDDFSGNGGGFMFDCRAMHNPGRYSEYKKLTGKDEPVIRFLEERGEVRGFLENAWALTDSAVERYIRRGFSNLQIGFGCTGGQHRSVYCAEATARHIRALFPEVMVNLVHREQS